MSCVERSRRPGLCPKIRQFIEYGEAILTMSGYLSLAIIYDRWVAEDYEMNPLFSVVADFQTSLYRRSGTHSIALRDLDMCMLLIDAFPLIDC